MVAYQGKATVRWCVGDTQVYVEATEAGSWGVEVGPLRDGDNDDPAPIEWNPYRVAGGPFNLRSDTGRLCLQWAVEIAETVLQKLWDERYAKAEEAVSLPPNAK